MQDNFDKYLDRWFFIISGNIKTLREEAGFSQETLAEKVSCSREFINRLENRKEAVSFKMLLKLAFTFDIPPQRLYQTDETSG